MERMHAVSPSFSLVCMAASSSSQCIWCKSMGACEGTLTFSRLRVRFCCMGASRLPLLLLPPDGCLEKRLSSRSLSASS